jgi:hypothetical protein
VAGTDILLPRSAIRSDRAPSRLLAVLIEVPEVKARRTQRRGKVTLPPARNHRRWSRRSRRRLRREIRLAGLALLTLAPLVSLGTLGWSSRPGRVLACSISDAVEHSAANRSSPEELIPGSQSAARSGSRIGSSGMITLSVEPAITTPGTEPRVPVVFPGYVLPDDAREDTAHAGS